MTRPTTKRLLLAGLLILPLAAFLTWTAFRQAPPAQTVAPPPFADSHNTLRPSQRARGQLSAGQSLTNLPTARRLSAQHVLKYGSGAGDLGMIREREQPPVGPESFALGADGTILVADVVNQRVVLYSADGAYLRSISLPGIALGDVMTDSQGRVYVYDQVRRALHQYDADGTSRSTLDLNPKDIDTRGYFHVTGNAVYFADAAVRDVLVAIVQDGALAAPDKSVERRTDGIHGESGRIYSMSLDKGQALRLQVRDAAVPAAARELQVPIPGIVSARYAGEDAAQRFYVQTERLAGSSIVLEVLAFSPAGELLATTRMPENDYALWTAKLVDVRADGTIVQFLPQKEQVKLNLFANQAAPGNDTLNRR